MRAWRFGLSARPTPIRTPNLPQAGAGRVNRASCNRRMAEKDLLDFPRRDVLPAPSNRILGAIDKAKCPVRVADHAVTGVEPQVPPGLDGLVGLAEIAGSERERFVR